MKSATNAHGIQHEAFTYRSTPLDKSRTEIRLLRLLHARDRSAPLACRIFMSALGPSGPRHPYKALSYVWGDSAKTHTISVLAEPHADDDIDDADDDGDPDHAPAVAHSDGESVAAPLLLLGITENLHAALVALRDADEDLTLWIDQICINQEEDNAEKESQVGLMGRVYSSASQVIVWLGPEADGSDAVMEAWQDIGQEARDLEIERYYTRERVAMVFQLMSGVGRGEPENPVAERMGDLVRRSADRFLPLIVDDSMWKWFCRPWFRRAWVVQEFCLCADTVFVCGRVRVDPKLVMLAVHINQHSISHFGRQLYIDRSVSLEQMDRILDQPAQRLLNTRERRQRFNRGEPHADGDQLHALLRRLYVEHETEATHHRDRIYSLLGLAVDADTLGIEPDYTEGAEATAQVLVDAARRMLTNPGGSARIDVLCFAQFLKLPELADHLPSWVPDWRGNLQRSYYMIQETTDPHLFAACGANHLAVKPVVPQPTDPRAVGLRGVVVDTIEAVSPSEPLRLTGDFDAAVILSYLAQIKAFVDVSMARMATTAPEEAAHNMYHQSSRERMAEARWRVPIADLYWIRSGIMNRAPPEAELYHRRAVEALQFVLECTPLPSEETERRFAEFRWSEKYRDNELGVEYRESLKYAINKRPFLTQNGHVGIAGGELQAGDVVVIFCGGRIPFVLRPLNHDGKGSTSVGMKTFAFIGEAYCHGIMDGEAFDERKLQDLILV